MYGFQLVPKKIAGGLRFRIGLKKILLFGTVYFDLRFSKSLTVKSTMPRKSKRFFSWYFGVSGLQVYTSFEKVQQKLILETSYFFTYFLGTVGPANQALHFYEFQLQSYRKAVDSWTIIGLRNKVVKDIRKMIGKMIWDTREDAAYSL
jgi:hypothetical protein